MIQTSQPFKPLGAEWNFPTHFKPRAYEATSKLDINILHYHNELSEAGFLKLTGVAWVDKFIQKANENLSQYSHFPEFKIVQKNYAASLK